MGRHPAKQTKMIVYGIRMKNKRNSLVPFEKSRRVIYLENRGRKRGRFSVGSVIFGIVGALCIFYCIAIGFSGFGTKFFLIWGAGGAACILIGAALAQKEWIASLPMWLKGAVTGLFCMGVLFFCAVEGLILSQYDAQARPGADYCIVLGAQWKTDGPSEVLRRRLDKAIEYLNANPETVAIVSGGQGSNEIISEAAGMRQYLLSAGIADERIRVEDQSTNTCENLAFSGAFVDKANSNVVVVTNDFHVFRAVKIARKQGYQAEGLAADSVLWMAPNNLLREFLGVLKDYAVGNM